MTVLLPAPAIVAIGLPGLPMTRRRLAASYLLTVCKCSLDNCALLRLQTSAELQREQCS